MYIESRYEVSAADDLHIYGTGGRVAGPSSDARVNIGVTNTWPLGCNRALEPTPPPRGPPLLLSSSTPFETTTVTWKVGVWAIRASIDRSVGRSA